MGSVGLPCLCCFLCSMAEHLVAAHTARSRPSSGDPQGFVHEDPPAQETFALPKRTPRRLAQGDFQSLPSEVILGEGQLRQVILQHFSDQGLSPPDRWRPYESEKEHLLSAFLDEAPDSIPLGAVDCRAQFDCHGDMLSLSLCSSPRLIGLSKGVLLTFQKLRVGGLIEA